MKKVDESKLEGLEVRAFRHLKKHRPKLFRELQQRGEVLAEVKDQAQQANDLYEHLWKNGVNAFEAHNRALREFILLPDVEEEPASTPANEATPPPMSTTE